MKRIGRTGQKWGRFALLSRAGVALDGKAVWWALADGLHDPQLRQRVVIQRRLAGDEERRTAWPIQHWKVIQDTDLGSFQSWHSMLCRCYRPSHVSYRHYGGRGIKVCDSWRPLDSSAFQRYEAFQRFMAHMGVRPDGCTLDRDDVNGDYWPSNCRWATPITQANNKRYRRAA